LRGKWRRKATLILLLSGHERREGDKRTRLSSGIRKLTGETRGRRREKKKRYNICILSPVRKEKAIAKSRRPPE